jgi:putative component of membrane protein insertase Oxa1/YidC/SpoIIIJ protein YidD
MRTRYVFYFLFTVGLFMMILILSLPARAIGPVPPGISEISANRSSSLMVNSDTSPFSWMIKFYQRYISPINGSRCPMYPSCSNFTAQVLNHEGEKGIIKVFDRLLRCGRDLEDYTLVFQRGRVLHLDPVIRRFECKTNESSE